MTDFPAMTNEQINRWVAERDGHVISGPKQTYFGHPNYADSADSALALLGRWNILVLEARQNPHVGGFWTVQVAVGLDCPEKDCKAHAKEFPRALINAACAAKEAMEVKIDV